MARTVNAAGLVLIKKFESLALRAYLCPAGVWTIGWGHTRGVREGDKISLEQAEAMLAEDVAEAARIVEQHVMVPLTDNQFAALASFVFNVGPGKKGVKDGFVTLKSGQPSTVLRVLNAGKYDMVAVHGGKTLQGDDIYFGRLLSWVNAGGRRLKGLVRRRVAEAALWCSK